MSDNTIQNTDTPVLQTGGHDLQRRDDVRFQSEVESLIRDVEDTRLRYMKDHRTRNFFSFTVGVISIIAGAGCFGWLFLMEGNLPLALLAMIGGVLPPLVLAYWAKEPLKAYTRNHKTEFMPKMAELLGGLTFHPTRGISSKIVNKTGVIQLHDIYEAEDCFMGTYKSVKVILSEARLYRGKKSTEPVFDGIFALLEIPEKIIEGHTIITADHDLAKRAAPTIWKKFKPVKIQTENPDWNRFQIFSTRPEAASLLIGERLLKELAEAAEIFNNAPLSAVLFAGKFIFVSIPYDEDMFEASNMYIPVTTQKHAMQCKKEIEQILEIIDVFELYKTQGPAGDQPT